MEKCRNDKPKRRHDQTVTRKAERIALVISRERRWCCWNSHKKCGFTEIAFNKRYNSDYRDENENIFRASA